MADFDAAGKGNLLIRDGFRFKDVDVDEKTNCKVSTKEQISICSSNTVH